MNDSVTRPRVRLKFLAAVVGLAALVGAAYLAIESRRTAVETSFKQALLLKDLEQMAAYSQILELMAQGREEKAREIAEHWIAESSSQAGNLLNSGIDIGGIGPNLREGVRRTRSYGLDHSIDPLVRNADDILRVISSD